MDCRAVGYLLRDVEVEIFFTFRIALQVRTKRSTECRRIDDTVKQGQEVRVRYLLLNQFTYTNCNTTEFVTLQVDVALDFREVEHTGRKVERIVYIQVNQNKGSSAIGYRSR